MDIRHKLTALLLPFALLLSLLASAPAHAAQLLATVAKADITVCAAGKLTFVAGYTNGYIYYLPTEAPRKNTGYAQ